MLPDSTSRPINITGFNGLYNRGLAETCPPDHLQQCNNCIFPGKNQIGIREPVTYSSTSGISGRQIIAFQIITPVTKPILLTLGSDGKLYDETNVVLLGTFTGATDFCTLSVFSRTYISLKTNGKAFPSGYLYYYDGTNFVPAAGAAPSLSAGLAQVNPGIVDAGVHIVAISFEYATGYLSPPSTIPSNITATGVNDIELSSIPIGNTYVVARHILMTMANQTELFFVPGGIINDNSTTIATINIHDSALVQSADYLNDIKTTLPSCSSLRLYHGRLVLIGVDVLPDILLVSYQQDPETINTVINTVTLPTDYGVNTTNTAAIIRDVLYAMKPNGTYAVQDNGGDASTWSVTSIDTGLGTYDTGLSIFSSAFSGQDILDQCLVLNKRGLLLFNGSFSDPPLSYKIDSLWQTFLASYMFEAQLAHDIYLKRIYIFIPASATLLMGDYQDGLSANAIKWSTWDFSGGGSGILNTAITKISIENFSSNYGTTIIYNFTFCAGDIHIYKCQFPGVSYSTPGEGDFYNGTSSLPINQIIQTANFDFGDGVNIFTALNIGAVGWGILNIVLNSKRGEVTYPTIYNSVVNTLTTGKIVNWVSGSLFTGLSINNLVLINGVYYTIATVTSTQLTLTTSPGNQSGVALYANTIQFNLTYYNPYLVTGTLLPAAGSNLYRGINFLSEYASITLSCNSVFNFTGLPNYTLAMFQLSSISLYGKVLYKIRPTMVQTL